MIDQAQLEKLCNLAQLLPAKDDAAQREQLGKILHLFDALDAFDTSHLEALAHPSDAIDQPMREDIVTEQVQRSLFQEVAPSTSAGLYLVPPVIADNKES